MKRNRRQHLDPVKHQRWVEYYESRRKVQKTQTSPVGSDIMDALAKGLDNPANAFSCATRLLSDYGYAELGSALYMRARRIVDPPGDPIRAKIVPRGKPGRLTKLEAREYRTRAAVEGIKELVGLE